MTKGIEVTESGVDIPSAQDSQKVLDSRWRYMEILQEKLITMPTLVQTIGAQIIYNHNVGFLPAFDVYDTVLDQYITGASANGAGLLSDTQNLYFNSFYNDNGWSGHPVIIRIYNVPITEEYQAPVAQTLPVKPSSPSKFGIKMARDTTDFHEAELSDFTVNTTGKGLAIQRTGLAISNSGSGFKAIIPHNIGLPPTFLATYADNSRNWVSVIDPDFVPAKGASDGANLTLSGFQSALVGTVAYIIFKELGDFAI